MKAGSVLRLGVAVALMAIGGAAQAAAPLAVERVVVLMRHGVRPPTKDPAMPAGVAADPWPGWTVRPGYLTQHGAAAVRLLGASDRAWLAASGVLPGSGCPAAGAIEVKSDSDQRTIETGDNWLAGLAPGCAIPNQHKPRDAPDPLFATTGENDVPVDPARADKAVADGLGAGGVKAAEAAQRATLDRLDQILCGAARPGCGVGGTASSVESAGKGKRPKLGGALDSGSTAAQILLLEYAEGKPMGEVGWGRATPADITRLSTLHAVEFAILARPPYIAWRNLAPVARAMKAALSDQGPDAPKLLAFIAHDTNVASLGGLLDLHWQPPGFARDDPPPGGALFFELLRDGAGKRFVRASFRSQSLDQMRTLATTPFYRQVIPIGKCGGATLCPLDRFLGLIGPVD